jgi:hypothetical protein
MFPSTYFKVSVLILRSLIHFEFVSIQHEQCLDRETFSIQLCQHAYDKADFSESIMYLALLKETVFLFT